MVACNPNFFYKFLFQAQNMKKRSRFKIGKHCGTVEKIRWIWLSSNVVGQTYQELTLLWGLPKECEHFLFVAIRVSQFCPKRIEKKKKFYWQAPMLGNLVVYHKVQLFWKGHKNLKKNSHLFWCYWVKPTVLSKQAGDFSNFVAFS